MVLRFVAAAVLLAVSLDAAPQSLDESVAAAVRAARLTIFDDVTARVDADVVVLGGAVTATRKRDAIVLRILHVPGVRTVQNGIRVLPESAGDEGLRQKVARAIYGNATFWQYAALPNPPIRILVENGHVTLSGVVRAEAERALAGSLAAGGEYPVTNALRVDGASAGR